MKKYTTPFFECNTGLLHDNSDLFALTAVPESLLGGESSGVGLGLPLSYHMSYNT